MPFDLTVMLTQGALQGLHLLGTHACAWVLEELSVNVCSCCALRLPTLWLSKTKWRQLVCG